MLLCEMSVEPRSMLFRKFYFVQCSLNADINFSNSLTRSKYLQECSYIDVLCNFYFFKMLDFNPLATEYFLLTSIGCENNVLHIFTWCGTIFGNLVLWQTISVIWDLHMFRVELEHFCKKQSCTELKSSQNGVFSNNI